VDFELSEEQKLLRRNVREFTEAEIKPVARELDETGRYPRAILKKAAALGLTGITVAERYGGAGMDHVSYAIAIEEIARACASTAVILSVHNSLYCGAIEHFGTEEQKQRLLAPFARGEKIGAYALSEPQAGSNAAALTTRAVRRGDRYIVNGTKAWVTSGEAAEAAVVFVSTQPEKGQKGITALVIEKGAAGFSVGREEKKLGVHATACCGLAFTDCEVPVANRLGDEGQGYKIALTTLDSGRVGIAAQAIGIAQGALDAALAYAHERRAFGRPIADLQAIQFMLADMATEIEAARLLAWRAAWKHDSGARFSKEAAMAKLFASEMASRVTHRAMQIHGANGYSTEYPVERAYRDARVTEIYEGTSEIQRLVIASWALRG